MARAFSAWVTSLFGVWTRVQKISVWLSTKSDRWDDNESWNVDLLNRKESQLTLWNMGVLTSAWNISYLIIRLGKYWWGIGSCNKKGYFERRFGWVGLEILGYLYDCMNISMEHSSSPYETYGRTVIKTIDLNWSQCRKCTGHQTLQLYTEPVWKQLLFMVKLLLFMSYRGSLHTWSSWKYTEKTTTTNCCLIEVASYNVSKGPIIMFQRVRVQWLQRILFIC